jgi:hypothetical protein
LRARARNREITAKAVRARLREIGEDSDYIADERAGSRRVR